MRSIPTPRCPRRSRSRPRCRTGRSPTCCRPSGAVGERLLQSTFTFTVTSPVRWCADINGRPVDATGCTRHHAADAATTPSGPSWPRSPSRPVVCVGRAAARAPRPAPASRTPRRRARPSALHRRGPRADRDARAATAGSGAGTPNSSAARTSTAAPARPVPHSVRIRRRNAELLGCKHVRRRPLVGSGSDRALRVLAHVTLIFANGRRSFQGHNKLIR